MRTARLVANVAIASPLKRLRLRPHPFDQAAYTSLGRRSLQYDVSTHETPSSNGEEAEEVTPSAWWEQHPLWHKTKNRPPRRPPIREEDLTRHFEWTPADRVDAGLSSQDTDPMMPPTKEPFVPPFLSDRQRRADRQRRTGTSSREMFLHNHMILTETMGRSQTDVRGDDGMYALQRDTKGRFMKVNHHWSRNWAAAYAKALRPELDLNTVVASGVRKEFLELVVTGLRQTNAGASDRPLSFEEANALLEGVLKAPSHNSWSGHMILVLRHLPHLAPQYLQRTYPITRPPFYMVADTLDFITRFCMQTPGKDEASHKMTPHQAVEMILELIAQSGKDATCLHASTIQRLLRHVDLTHGYSLFYGLQSFETPLVKQAYISFADFFAHHGSYESACEALDLYTFNRGQVKAPEFTSITAKILRRSILSPHGYHDSGWIISRFLEMGHHVGRHLQNVLISNAFDSRDSGTAVNVFRLMIEQGTEPDSFTYASMIKGLRSSEDAELTEDVLGMAWANVEETGDAYLSNEVLWWYYAQAVRKADNAWEPREKEKIHVEVLQQLVSLYTRVYDSTPLEVLGLANLVPTDMWAPPPHEALEPDHFTISLLIMAYTRAKVLAIEADPSEGEHIGNYGTNYRLYRRFWLLTTQPHLFPDVPPWVSSLFQDMVKDSPRILNIFMHALGAQKSTLLQAIKILQRMDIGSFNLVKSNSGVEDSRIDIAAPNLYTWSIILNALASHGQVAAVEKCFRTLESKGLTPDATVFNTLVKAHAVAQDVEGVIRALTRKERRGFGHDAGVIRTLKRVKNQKVLQETLRKEVERREFGAEGLMGRAERTVPWSSRSEERVGYEPGVGRRRVAYFDANRMSGLRKESFTAYEESEEGVYVPAGTERRGRILQGQGSYSLKSEDENDWFEDDEEEDGLDKKTGNGEKDEEEFGWSPMVDAEVDAVKDGK